MSPPSPRTTVNVAEICHATRALGPGLRAVVWVQGCPFRCRGCIAPDWIPDRPARPMTSAELAAELLHDPGVEGLTLSGGEPMAQAGPLAAAVRRVREVRDVSVLCFTGFRREELADRPDAADLLTLVDVLIDGRYVQARNDDRGLRGSSNQRVHHLTGRLAGFDLANTTRGVEIHLNGREALMVGVPPRAAAAAWRRLGGSDDDTDNLNRHESARRTRT